MLVDVIEVVTIAGHAAVYVSTGGVERDPAQDVVYWRQAFDCWTPQLLYIRLLPNDLLPSYSNCRYVMPEILILSPVLHTRGQAENLNTSGSAEVESDSAECQTDAPLRLASHKDDRESQPRQNRDCDLSPQQVSTSTHAPPGALMPESPLLPRAMRRLHEQIDYVFHVSGKWFVPPFQDSISAFSNQATKLLVGLTNHLPTSQKALVSVMKSSYMYSRPPKDVTMVR